MTIEYITTGGAILMTMLGVIGSVLVALIQSNRRLTKKGIQAAEDAAEKAEPISNGFAPDVRAALKRIERRQDEQAERLHEQGRALGGIRADARVERTERIVLAKAVSRLIEKEN